MHITFINMSSKWQELKELYIEDHLSKKLQRPDMRLNSLKKVEEMLLISVPAIIKNPYDLRRIGKNMLLEKLEEHKGVSLNGTEKSVVNGLYTLLPELERIR